MDDITWELLDVSLDGQATRLLRDKRPFLRSNPAEWWNTLTQQQRQKWAARLEKDLAAEMCAED